MIDRYFDNAATTPVDPRVVEAMRPFWTSEPGNAHSIHAWGREARRAVDRAREQVATLIGAEDPSEVVFTSGATESNNWVLSNFKNVAVSPFEHSSVLEPATRRGSEVLGNDGFILSNPSQPPDLLSVMLVNNETGAILDLPSTVDLMHRDITQAVGKIDFELEEIDFASFSSHKIHGPKGVGALYIKSGEFIEPLLVGGGQENGLRAGTLNVPGIVGFGEAASLATQERDRDAANASRIRAALLYQIHDLESWSTHDHTSQSPFILSLTFDGIQGETLLIELDRQGFGLSSGAACSSSSEEPSHVLRALKVVESNLRSTIRVSFGRFNTIEAASALGAAVRSTVCKLRELTR